MNQSVTLPYMKLWSKGGPKGNLNISKIKYPFATYVPLIIKFNDHLPKAKMHFDCFFDIKCKYAFFFYPVLRGKVRAIFSMNDSNCRND